MPTPRFMLPLVGPLVTVVALQVPPALAQDVPSRMQQLAARSVVAVVDRSTVRTGFAFGDSEAVMTSGDATASTRLVTARGASLSARSISRVGKIVILRGSYPDLPGLQATASHTISRGTTAYVLGPPLGYEANRLKRIRLPVLKPQSSELQAVTGVLPAAFQGAPVLSSRGRVLGMVYAIAAHEWMLEPAGRLLTVLPAAKAGGGSFPLLFSLAGIAFVLVAASGGVMLRLRSRRAHLAERTREMDTSSTHPVGAEVPSAPLVRRREPAQERESTEDFEVVIKGREDA